MTTLVLLVLVVVAVAAATTRAYRRPRTPGEEPHLHFSCPGCGRRLRYRARRAGRPGLCPGCGRGLTFPPLGSDAERRGRVRDSLVPGRRKGPDA